MEKRERKQPIKDAERERKPVVKGRHCRRGPNGEMICD
jgi:hypothetical protein